jgi:hypothetical protein
MIGALILAVVGVVSSPEVGQAQMQSAFDACRRLATLASIDPAGATPEERAARQARKAELDALLIYVQKIHAVISIGRWQPQDYLNYLTVQQQLATAGAALAVFPEEALCWQQAGLNCAAAGRLFTWQRVAAGKEPPQNLHQAEAQYERFRGQYKEALARCTADRD